MKVKMDVDRSTFPRVHVTTRLPSSPPTLMTNKAMAFTNLSTNPNLQLCHFLLTPIQAVCTCSIIYIPKTKNWELNQLITLASICNLCLMRTLHSLNRVIGTPSSSDSIQSCITIHKGSHIYLYLSFMSSSARMKLKLTRKSACLSLKAADRFCHIGWS